MVEIVHLDAVKLRECLAQLYNRAGCLQDEARAVADHLVAADLAGHPSHGSGLTPLYLAGIDRKTLIPNRTAEPVPTKGDFLLFDGQSGFGQSVGLQVCDAVAKQVDARGVAIFGLRNVHHLGRLGAYGEYLAQRGVISATFTNVASRPMVAAFNGRTAVLGTNPVCICIPRTDGPPVLLDFATSTIAVGKVRVALERGESTPAGALIDGNGRPTCNPAVMYPPPGDPPGALMPMAAHKGGGLNLICELLAACIAGATMDAEYGEGVILNNMVGMAFAAGSTEGAAKAIEAAISYYSASPMLEGHQLHLPGGPEIQSRAQLETEGIPMPRATWAKIVDLALAQGITEAEMRRAER